MAGNDRGLLPYLIVILVVVLIGGGVWFLVFMPSGGGARNIDVACKASCWNWKNATGVKKKTAAIEYCTRAFDLGGEPRKITKNGTTYCSNGVHCFNTYSCSDEGRTLTAATCQQILFNYYQQYNGESRQTAAQHVVDIYTPANNETGVGTCELDAGWYTRNLDGTDDILGQ
ncbi:MAG: hypothetical protein SVU32_08445 [Candidatus Nanohaloarchaea archaeon]|nr:hypothetical protein [Candidatus Nanohaloarchaea archaeon]